MEQSERDQVIMTLRPELALGNCKTEEEQFQNQVLRPILKFQNEVIIELCKNYITRHYRNFNALKQSAQETLLIRASKQDPEFRNPLIYIIVALLSSAELKLYNANRASYNKRIVQMALQRILSQLERLY